MQSFQFDSGFCVAFPETTENCDVSGPHSCGHVCRFASRACVETPSAVCVCHVFLLGSCAMFTVRQPAPSLSHTNITHITNAAALPSSSEAVKPTLRQDPRAQLLSTCWHTTVLYSSRSLERACPFLSQPVTQHTIGSIFGSDPTQPDVNSDKTSTWNPTSTPT